MVAGKFDKYKASCVPLTLDSEQEIQAVRELNAKEAQLRALAALSYLHKGRPDLARLVLVLGINSAKEYAKSRGIALPPCAAPVAAPRSATTTRTPSAPLLEAWL